MSDSWWKEGLPFACTMCGKCCHARGEVAQVYVNRAEREALADHLGLGRKEFDRRYTRRDETGHRTLSFRDGACVFLEGASCRVHEAKPVQCRTWPFWAENLESPAAWQEAVLDFCPGSRAEEPVVPAAEIARQAAATDAALEQD